MIFTLPRLCAARKFDKEDKRKLSKILKKPKFRGGLDLEYPR
jgi:hypothetical protein